MKILRLLPRFKKAYRSLNLLKERESWGRAQIQDFQLARINSLWSHAIQHVPYYRELCAKHELPSQFQNLAEFSKRVPRLPKQIVRDRPTDFISGLHKPDGSSQTSGSTGTPMRFYWGAEDHRDVLRAKYRFYNSWGVDILDRTVFLWSCESEGGWKRIKQQASDRLRSRLRLDISDLSTSRLRSYLDEISAFRPVVLYGFSNALYLLAREALATQFSCDSLKIVVYTSENASPQMIATMRQAFQAQVVMEYGATECELIAGQMPDEKLRVREDVAFVETVQNEDQRYEILLTVLGNPSFPLIRYAIEDLSSGPLELPDRGFAILPGIAGRDDDVAYSSSGVPIHPSHIDSLLEQHHSSVRSYQVRQAVDGDVLVTIELVDPEKSSAVEFVNSQMQKLFGEFDVATQVIGENERANTGKHRVVTSEYKR